MSTAVAVSGSPKSNANFGNAFWSSAFLIYIGLCCFIPGIEAFGIVALVTGSIFLFLTVITMIMVAVNSPKQRVDSSAGGIDD